MKTMKNSQKGFIVPVLLVVIALLVVGGGIYIYKNKKVEVPAVVNTGTQQTNNPPTQTDTSFKVLSPKAGDSWKIGGTYSVKFQNLPKGSFVQGWLQDKNGASTGSASIGVVETGRDGNPSSNIQITIPSQWCGGECGAVEYVTPGQYRLLLRISPSSHDSSYQTFYSDYFTLTSNSKAIDWESLLPSMRTALKQAFPNERIEESRSISIYKKVDVTGDGIPEVLVNLGTGGATTDLVTSMRIENDKPIAPLFKQKDGKISILLFSAGAGGSGRYGSTAEMLANKNAIYSASYSKYGESADYCRAEAYQWNSQTKIFEYNIGLSNEVQQDYCKTAGTGL